MIFEKAMVGIFRSSADGRVLNVNPASARILGFDTPEEMVGTVMDVGSQLYVNPEDRAKLLRLLDKESVAEGFETHLFKKDRSIIRALLNIDCVKDEKGRIVCLAGTLQDITTTRESEEALKQAEEKYRNIYENAVEGIFQTTPDGRIVSANPALAHILGYDSPADLIANIDDGADRSSQAKDGEKSTCT